jgi:hypothetical protein
MNGDVRARAYLLVLQNNKQVGPTHMIKNLKSGSQVT